MNIIKKIRLAQKMNQTEFAEILNVHQTAVSQWETGRTKPDIQILKIIAEKFNVPAAELLETEETRFPSPDITEAYTTFPVIGEIAAGYDHIAAENWDGEKVDIPNSYLKGRNKEDFFVLLVTGDSMYPEYQNGDKVLILKQTTLNYSGQIGAVLYDGDFATLKKVEYAQGEDWMRLVAINPAFPPIKITDADLEHCRILGIPKLIVREV